MKSVTLPRANLTFKDLVDDDDVPTSKAQPRSASNHATTSFVRNHNFMASEGLQLLLLNFWPKDCERSTELSQFGTVDQPF